MIIIVVEKIQGTGTVLTHGRNVQVFPLIYVPIDENHNRHLHQVFQSSKRSIRWIALKVQVIDTP